MIRSLRESLLGKPLDPFSGETRKHVALVAFLAWVGLGADGLSSACYGPEEAFLALGVHTPLGLYLAGMTAITVFVIAVAYNQVIELFPSGGGGYKVATTLLGARAGLVSGTALFFLIAVRPGMSSCMFRWPRSGSGTSAAHETRRPALLAKSDPDCRAKCGIRDTFRTWSASATPREGPPPGYSTGAHRFLAPESCKSCTPGSDV